MHCFLLLLTGKALQQKDGQAALGWNLGLGRLVLCSLPFEGGGEHAKAAAFQPGTSDQCPQYPKKSAEMASKGDSLCP